MSERDCHQASAKTPKGFRSVSLLIALMAILFSLHSSPAPAEPASKSFQDSWLSGPPTLGGRQLWADRRYQGGWRIQRHVWTGRYRLLDQLDHLRASGTASEVNEAFNHRRTQGFIPANKPRAVVLLHGLGRTRHMFPALSQSLRDQDYEVIALAYPSTRQSLEDHADGLAKVVQQLEGVEQVSFVTHSLGGLVLRQYLAKAQDQRLHRAVLVAAPNKGAHMARLLEDLPGFHLIGGPASERLSDDLAKALPEPTIPFAVIAGISGDGEGYSPILPGEDDGVVGLSEALLPGAEAFLTLEALHTFIADAPGSRAFIRDFLARP